MVTPNDLAKYRSDTNSSPAYEAMSRRCRSCKKFKGVRGGKNNCINGVRFFTCKDCVQLKLEKLNALALPDDAIPNDLHAEGTA